MKNTGFFQPVLAKYSKSFNLSDTLSAGAARERIEGANLR
jgi:hypothetical protein